MRILPTTFGSDDFQFQQLEREGDIALFVKQKPPLTFKSYEVVIVQKRDQVTWRNGLTTPTQTPPSSRDWGKYGWTFQTLEDAELRSKAW